MIPPLDTAPTLLVAAPLLLCLAGLLLAPLAGLDRRPTRIAIVAVVALATSWPALASTLR